MLLTTSKSKLAAGRLPCVLSHRACMAPCTRWGRWRIGRRCSACCLCCGFCCSACLLSDRSLHSHVKGAASGSLNIATGSQYSRGSANRQNHLMCSVPVQLMIQGAGFLSASFGSWASKSSSHATIWRVQLPNMSCVRRAACMSTLDWEELTQPTMINKM